jgi:copper chaperone CopZ
MSCSKLVQTTSSVYLALLLVNTLQLGEKVESAPVKSAPLHSAMKPPAEESSNASSSEILHKYNPKTLHRLDFRVVGKSCAVCLHHMQEKMKSLPGVVKAAIMIRKPYGAVVIYDSTQVNVEKVLAKTKEGVPEVAFEDVQDEAIKELPVILIPKTAVPAG